MFNVIVPIVDKLEEYLQFFKKQTKTGVKFYVGITQSLAQQLPKLRQIEVHVFADKTNKEQMINALQQCNLSEGKILIARRPLEQQEFSALVKSQSDITTLKAKHGKFYTWLKNLGRFIIKKFFAFTYFEDISAICYGENMFQLVSVCANLSMASRVNKYVGVSIDEIETDSKPVKKDYNKPWTFAKFALYTAFALGSIAGGILVCIFTKVTAITVMLVLLWYVVAIMLWFVGLLNFMRTLSVGDLRFAKAEEIVVEKKTSKNK